MKMHPRVSVVIPTRNRPESVRRAVMSVLSQTVEDIELIVVIDGPDLCTAGVLSEMHDRRLRYVELPRNVGGSEARNEGIRQARTDWIALLDDDDEWLPAKLERQLSAVERTPYILPVIATQVIARSSQGDFIWPRRPPNPAEHVGEYLFVRRTMFMGEGFLQTSSLLAPRSLFQAIPFHAGLQRHEDWDWLLRVWTIRGVGLELVMEPLVVWNDDMGRSRISTKRNWRQSLEWIQSVPHLVTPKVYAGFIVTVVSPNASKQGAWDAFGHLFKKLIICRGARTWDFFLFFTMWLVPISLRSKVRKMFTARR